ncbi:hypothetical protein [Rhodococcus sp. NKCM2511]|uniref:hypothetical protein n=1 Tax=Rhodococcus sp. NKCM2511 TaxID=2766011 RepID=UPI00190FC949|nr:hypothetical protein [Rhodococcus sp. NKCM2511]
MTISMTVPPRSPIAWAARLFDSRLPADVKGVGAFLAERADDKLVSAPGIAAIRAATGLLEWRCIRALHDLQMTGYIVKVASAKPFQAESHDAYRLEAPSR